MMPVLVHVQIPVIEDVLYPVQFCGLHGVEYLGFFDRSHNACSYAITTKLIEMDCYA